jgi:hypothetical protein
MIAQRKIDYLFQRGLGTWYVRIQDTDSEGKRKDTAKSLGTRDRLEAEGLGPAKLSPNTRPLFWPGGPA